MGAEALPERTRHLVGIVAAAAAGRFDDVESRVDEALTADPDILPALREAIFQLVPYCGWAVALNAVTAIRKEFGERGLTMPASAPALEDRDRPALRTLGDATARAVHPLFGKVADGLAEFSPDLVNHLTETAYGYIYNRPGLDLVTRELLAVAILSAASHEPQLRYHMEGARNVGASQEMVQAVIEESNRASG